MPSAIDATSKMIIPLDLGHGNESLPVENMTSVPRSREGSPSSPMSSMGAASMQEGPAPPSPPNRGASSRGDREAPMGYHPPYGGAYHGGHYGHNSHPAYGGYGAGGGQYPPPPPPGYGYPPHMPYPPGYGPPPYGYGYGGYPTQHAQPRQNESSQHPQEKARGQSSKKSPARRGSQEKTLASPSQARQLGPPTEVAPSETQDKENDAQDTLDSTVNVMPMRSDFHFFVDDVRERLQKETEDEVKASTDKEDPFIFLTNLNMRLTQAWENAAPEARTKYYVKEEEDRKRFMMDEEVASRHCATLTARAKSPRASTKDTPKGTVKDVKKEELKVVVPESSIQNEESTTPPNPAAESSSHAGEPPVPAITVEANGSAHEVKPTESEGEMEESTLNKRNASLGNNTVPFESPLKKSRQSHPAESTLN